ncbi:WD40-repeat-containing domain protein [Sordaria brevicollis]|uniref:WD40-repeat-containing domain protein n=1 Tax=Sordaria brevicollis TaxID=83679 RepID=A0AAE0U9S0_SORBR|nr:WD40-repeat-containing domain protein [Sordaria brevicollis]
MLHAQLVLWDDKNKKQGGVISAQTSIRGAKMSSKRIVLVLMDRVQVYQTGKPHPLLSTYETTENPLGLCCLSSERIAFPGRTVGHVQLIEIASGNVSIIPGHTSALRAMALSQDGELLATASEQGTIIRVHATSTGAKLLELRRGLDKAVIFSLAFSPSGRYLACTSDKSTLHVFNVLRPSGGGNSTGRLSISSNSGNATAGTSEPASATGGGGRPSSPHSVISSSGGYGGGSVMVAGGGAGSADFVGGGGGGEDSNNHKWGFLSRIPFVPRAFSDAYSFASCKFEMGDEPVGGGSIGSGIGSRGAESMGGVGSPVKGNLGWISETELVVIGAGRDPKWEKFALQDGGQQNGGYPSMGGAGGGGGGGWGPGGGKQLVRVGWKRYGGETA